MRTFLAIFLLFFLGKNVQAQQPQPSPEERSVQLSATTQTNPPQINLQWKADPGATKYIVYRKSLNSTNWGNPIANLSGSATTYTDNNVQVGVGYEYAFFKEDFEYRRDTVCVPAGTQLQFTINDSNGIGLCCSFGNGFYEVRNCNNIVASGDEFDFSESTNFSACNDGNGCSEIYITVKPSMIDNSTYWNLQNTSNGQTIASVGAPGYFIRPRPEYGFIYAGIELPPVEDRGRILLVVEDDLLVPLATEIEELKMDFIKDGWRVSMIDVDRNDAVPSVHAAIQNVYNVQPDLNAVLLLGAVPIPFSGNIFPDTHIENEGAYPADVYYGEMNGTWTDFSVNSTVAPWLNIYHNVPGDGKFDQDVPPSGTVELQVGRVDFSMMSIFNQSETQLIQQYLNKNHQFKTRQINPVRRALMDDNIGQTTAAPAASGWRNFATMFGADNIFDVDYFSTLSSQSYLWSFGGGSGDSNSAQGIGTAGDFVNSNLQNIFNLTFGSQFGNWAIENNFLVAPLGSGQTLTSVYSGNPPWVLHHMAMGYHIGYSLDKTQNNPNDLYLPYGPALVSTALMGDPTLRMHMVQPPSNLSVTSTQNAVNLNWNAPNNETVAGYNIYRASSADGNFQKINNNTITSSSFSDNAPLSGDNFYLVKTLKLESSGSGTYYNLSLGVLGNTNFTGTGGGDTTPPSASLTTSSNNVNTSFTVTVIFSENINGLTLSGFNVSNATLSNLTGSGAIFSFTVSPISAGLVTVVLPVQTVTDIAANANTTPSNTLNITYSPSDTTPPTASLTTSSNNVNTSFTATVIFSENINGLTLSDFNVSNATLSNLTGSGAVFSFAVSPISAGLVTVVLPAQTVTDNAANANTSPSNSLNITYTPNTGGCNSPTNLAIGKLVSQHSTQFDAEASRANDGNTSGDFFGQNSVTLTNWTTHTWWEIDLGEVADIDEIRIYNRTDCCSDVLNNYYVLVSENQMSSIDLNATLSQSGVSDFLQNTVAASPSVVPTNTTGRYVRVQLADQGFLALAEVEIIGCFTGGGGLQDQSITFDAIPNKTITDAPFALNATASSSLPVSFQVLSGPASVSGNTILLNGNTGIVTVQATQNGNSQYNPAPNVTQTFTVNDNNSGCSNPTNIALGKTAIQSGTQLGADASKAIDGNTDGNFWAANSTSITDWIPNAWWEVDLGGISDIQTINLWNRTDCCENLFGNFQVLVSDVPFVSQGLNESLNQSGVSSFLENGTAARPTTININRTGRYVRVQLVGSAYLAISEVEIIGCSGGGSGCPVAGIPCNDGNPNTENDMEDGNCNCIGTPIGTGCSSTSNVTFNKTTSQSSTLTAAGITGSSSKAVDGNTNGTFFSTPSTSSVTATNFETQPWWEVDLGENHTIERINVFNRTDGSDKTTNCYVLVSNTPFGAIDLATARSQAIFEQYISGLVGSPSVVNLDVEGRYVRVQMEGDGYLVLAEVEVEGCTTNNSNNLILNTQTVDFQVVRQDETARLAWSGNANHLVDYFEIEKSIDGIEFDFFQTIESPSNYAGYIIYENLDATLTYGETFYRLKTIRKDGSHFYSPIRQVEYLADWSKLFLYPNPAKNEILVNLKQYISKNVTVQIFDARGVLMTTQVFENLENPQPVFDLEKYGNGIYVMAIKVEGKKMLTEKFIIEKAN